MKNRYPKDEENRGEFNASRPINPNKDIVKKKKNMRRLGGEGLSLEAFANAKSNTNSSYFNPALIKKQKEFYKNSKYVNKYKKSLKQMQSSNPPLAIKEVNENEDSKKDDNEIEGFRRKDNETKDGGKMSKNESEDSGKMRRREEKKKKHGARNLVEVYEKNHEEEEKARREREAMIQAKREEREKAEARRKSAREKMMKKTHKGQPLMKYRIEHILESLQGSVKQT